MFKIGDYAVILEEKQIKVIEDYEVINGEYIIYMDDGTSYHIDSLTTLEHAVKIEKDLGNIDKDLFVK